MSERDADLEPRVAALLVAHDAFRDERGRTHVIGIFDTIEAPRYPLAASFMVFCHFKGTRHGTYQGMLRVSDTLGEILAQTEQLTFEVTELKGHNFFIGMGVRLPGPGLYRVELFVDGRSRLWVPLMAREQKASPGPEGQTA
jgi:hypothetical protein